MPSVTAKKTGSNVTLASFTISNAQTIQWKAHRDGGGGNDFWLTNDPGADKADIALSKNLPDGFANGSQFLQPGTYHISIKLALMGDGSYTVTHASGSL